MQLFKYHVAVSLACVTVLVVVPSSRADTLNIERAKRAIGTKAYLVNGAGAVAYGARACRRLDANRVSCQAYVEKASGGGRTICVDRMTAVASGGKVRVRGAARPSEWRCSKVR